MCLCVRKQGVGYIIVLFFNKFPYVTAYRPPIYLDHRQLFQLGYQSPKQSVLFREHGKHLCFVLTIFTILLVISTINLTFSNLLKLMSRNERLHVWIYRIIVIFFIFNHSIWIKLKLLYFSLFILEKSKKNNYT